MDKVVIGMSGGVDSSVAALLLKQQGYDVIGATMKLQSDESCSSTVTKMIDDAKRVCDVIGIEHVVLDFTDLFRRTVIKNFVDEYAKAHTPNPCVTCNKYIKFKALLKKAEEMGAKYIATGHYAMIEYDDESGKYILRQANSTKDQSYVLYNMTQYELAHTLFPLFGMEKPEVRKIAEKFNLPVANKPDSQDICFVPGNDYAGFIRKYTGTCDEPGDFVDELGNVLGRHKGIRNYTVGQRKGLGLSLGKPAFVTKIDPVSNTVTIGSNEDLFSKEVHIKDVNFTLGDVPIKSIKCKAKIRYAAKAADAILYYNSDKNTAKVIFDCPQRAATKGQSVVFYDGDVVLGGGVIT